MSKPKTITIDDVQYIRADSIKNEERATNTEGLDYVIVRTYSAGVFAGWLEELTGKTAIVLKARRLWYWDGAASLSQLAEEGVSKPENCKFPCEVEKIILTEAIEIIPCTEKARMSIKGVEIWKK